MIDRRNAEKTSAPRSMVSATLARSPTAPTGCCPRPSAAPQTSCRSPRRSQGARSRQPVVLSCSPAPPRNTPRTCRHSVVMLDRLGHADRTVRHHPERSVARLARHPGKRRRRGCPTCSRPIFAIAAGNRGARQHFREYNTAATSAKNSPSITSATERTMLESLLKFLQDARRGSTSPPRIAHRHPSTRDASQQCQACRASTGRRQLHQPTHSFIRLGSREKADVAPLAARHSSASHHAEQRRMLRPRDLEAVRQTCSTTFVPGRRPLQTISTAGSASRRRARASARLFEQRLILRHGALAAAGQQHDVHVEPAAGPRLSSLAPASRAPGRGPASGAPDVFSILRQSSSSSSCSRYGQVGVGALRHGLEHLPAVKVPPGSGPPAPRGAASTPSGRSTACRARPDPRDDRRQQHAMAAADVDDVLERREVVGRDDGRHLRRIHLEHHALEARAFGGVGGPAASRTAACPSAPRRPCRRTAHHRAGSRSRRCIR